MLPFAMVIVILDSELRLGTNCRLNIVSTEPVSTIRVAGLPFTWALM